MTNHCLDLVLNINFIFNSQTMSMKLYKVLQHNTSIFYVHLHRLFFTKAVFLLIYIF